MDADVEAADFRGEIYDRKLDCPRLQTQLQRVKEAMSDGKWHSLEWLSKATGAPEASVSARLRDMRRPVDKKGLGQRIDHERGMGGQWAYRWIQLPPDKCVECGHAEEAHGYGRTVGCQAGDGSEANPICGCRKMRGEMSHKHGDPYVYHGSLPIPEP